MKTRTVTEYRVTSTREGGHRKHKRYLSLAGVRDRIGILTSPEPWRFWGNEDDRERAASDFICCAGTRYDQCDCGGLTLAEATAQRRAELPPLVSIRVQRRQVTRTAWEDVELEAAHLVVTPRRENNDDDDA